MKRPSTRVLLLGLALAALTLAVYRQVGRHQFLDFDDVHYILENERVRDGLTAEGIGWAFTTFFASNWHPLTWLSHMADVRLFGLDAGRHHLVSAFFHAANAVLLFLALRGLTGALWPSIFAAALFALHPLHVESVAWTAERKDVLSAFFWALSLLAYLRYLRRPGTARYLAVSILFALGLMAKPMVITFPFILLILDHWPLGRTRARALGSLAMEKLPLFALAAASGVMTWRAQAANQTLAPLAEFPLMARAANAAVSYAVYAVKMFWPAGLAVFYPFPEGGPPLKQTVFSLVLLAGVTSVVVLKGRRYPYLPAGWLWFLGSLVPVIGLVQVGYQARADRYTYLPLVGLFIMLAWGAADIPRGRRFRRAALGAAGVLAILACAALTWVQLGYWRDGISLFEHTLAAAPDNWLTRYNLGHAYYDRGRIDEAVAQFRESLRMNPDFDTANNNLGLALSKTGRFREAITLYRRAVILNPDYKEAYFNLGLAYLGAGDRAAAVSTYQDLLRVDPEWAEKLWRFISYPMGR